MSFSNAYETETLEWLFTTTAVTRPTAWYLALYTAAPGEAGGGTEVSTSGTAYARQSITFSVSGNLATNSAAIEYPTATASYGTVSHVGVFDASTGGTLIAYAALSSSKNIDTGDVFRVPTNDLDITLN